MDTGQGSEASLERRGREAENALEELRAALEVLSRVAIEADPVEILSRQVAACSRAFLSLPLPQQPRFADGLGELERSIEAAREAVLTADLEVPIGTFRRKLSPGTLPPYQLAAYARALASRPFEGGARQARFELATMYTLAAETSVGKLEMRPVEEGEALLDYVVDGMDGDASRREDAVAFFDEARGRLPHFQNTEEMFEANFDRDLKRYKAKLGGGLLDRAILRAMVHLDVALHVRCLELPASGHPMSLAPGPGPVETPPERDVLEDADDRVAMIADVLAVVKELGVEGVHVELLESALAVCVEGQEALGEADSPGFEERLAQHHEALEMGERTAIDVDAKVSMGAFRSWFDRTPRPREALLRHARLLGSRRLYDETQKDRLEFIATRVLSTKQDDGRLRMSTRDAAAPVLEYILPARPGMDDQERSAAVMFFRDASLRLSALHSLDDIFSGGFYLDVRGYKVALREQLADRDILYAAVALNVAIHNRIEEMRELESRSKNSLVTMLGKQEEEVRKVFVRRIDASADQRFEETRRYLDKYRKNVGVAKTARRIDRRTLMRTLLAVAILGTGLLALKVILREDNVIVDYSDEELARLSPVLETGGISRGADEPAFIGRVASARWMLLNPEERSAVAERIRARLARRNVADAWISRDGHQAIHIANGEVMSVE